MHPRANAPPAPDSPLLTGFALAFGIILGLAFLKFPNPPVLEHLAVAPNGVWECALVRWPVRYAYPLLGVCVLAGLGLMRWPRGVSLRLALLPLLWLGWVTLSCLGTIDARLSGLTAAHFLVCVVCFYLGLLVLGRARQPAHFLAGIIGALVLVMLAGWEQHFGGLERTRDYFYTYIYPTQPEVHPDMLKKMQSDRIFGTLFYPNSLAGVLLLAVPAVLGLIADARTAFTIGARWLLGGVVTLGAAGCLVWSGSKAGWLLAMAGGVAVLLRLPIQKRIKVVVVVALLVAGAAGFTAKYMGFFQRGAMSVVARFDYWTAAAQNIKLRPVFGSGPGTFAAVYQELKPPEAEMARLVHNDYLQQASDSGVVAGLLFAGFVGWVLWSSRTAWQGASWAAFGVALGVALFAVQSLVEFGFYIPATAWCWFALAGWLVARRGLGFDNRPRPA